MQTTLTRSILPEKYANRVFFLCCATYIIGLFGRLSYASVMAELIAAEGFSKADAGLIGTSLFIVYGICQLISGFLGDRVSPKRLIFCGVVGSAVLNIAMAMVGSYRLMLLVWSLNGVFQSLIWSPVARIFAEWLPPSCRRRACENAAITYQLATILTYLFAALLLHTLGWRAVFLLSAVLMLFAAAFWLIRMSFYEHVLIQEGETEVLTPTALEAKGNLPGLLLISGAIFALACAVAQGLLRDGIQAWVPTFLIDNFHFAASAAVASSILLPLINISGIWITRAIAKRYISNELSGTAGFFGGAILSLLALLPLSGTSAAGSLFLLTLASTCMVGANIMTINLLPVHFGAIGRASSVSGILNCMSYLGSALSSYGIGKAAAVFGWNAAIYVWLGFSVLALVSALLGARQWQLYRKNI